MGETPPTYTLRWPPAGFTVKVWCNLLPDEFSVHCESEPLTLPASQTWPERRGAVSLWRPSNVNQFGLVGGTFEPNDSDDFKLYLPTITPNDYDPHEPYIQPGIPEERHKEALIRGMTEGLSLPRGSFHCTAIGNDVVGTGPIAFYFAGRALYNFFSLASWDEQSVNNRSLYAISPP